MKAGAVEGQSRALASGEILRILLVGLYVLITIIQQVPIKCYVPGIYKALGI